MRSIFTVITFLVIAVSVYGQGAYLERGQSGIDIGAGFSTTDDGNDYFWGNVGYSVSGIFDFGISVGRLNYDEKLFNSDLSATVISPNITVYALKQNDDIPLSFAIGAGYEWVSYSNDVLNDYNIDMTGWAFSVGGSLFGYFQASNSFRIQPSVSFSYVTAEIKLEDSYGNEESEKDDTTVFSLALGLAFNTSPKNILVISPRVGISENTTISGVVLSFIFGTN